MKKALVVGGSGFLGSHLVKHLTLRGYEVFTVVHKNPLHDVEGIHLIRGGIQSIDHRQIDEIDPEFVFHCARPTFPSFRRIGRITASFVAKEYNRHLIRQLKKTSSRPRLIFASGSLMYGNSTIPRDESARLQPISYARQYSRGESPFNDLVSSEDYPLQILRFPWLLGYGSWFYWFYLESIRNYHAIPAFGDMSNMMEIIDVEDAAQLMILYASGTEASEIFNIPSSSPVSQLSFIKILSDIFGTGSKDYKSLFPGKMEKEMVEAFTSNILLSTRYDGILKEFTYTPFERSLERIKQQAIGDGLF